jgi:hypothetical protein
MYPSCERLNREDQERAYLRQAAPDLSQRDRWRLAEALAEMPHERRLALIGKERAQAVELLKGRPTAGSTRVRTR